MRAGVKGKPVCCWQGRGAVEQHRAGGLRNRWGLEAKSGLKMGGGRRYSSVSGCAAGVGVSTSSTGVGEVVLERAGDGRLTVVGEGRGCLKVEESEAAKVVAAAAATVCE